MTGLDIPVTDAVDRYVERKAVGDPDGPGAGTYATNAESILRRWAAWLREERAVETLAELDVDVLRSYAQLLRVRAVREEYAPSTARTYFAVVRAFCSWCVSEGALESNPADADAATAALPAADGGTGERSETRSDEWASSAGRTLERFVRRRAADAVAADRLTRMREYALVSLVVHTDLRGAELFRVPEDDRRTGATWDDVDFYSGTIRVLGKSQRLEDVPIPAPARTPLRRYRVALDPPTNEWPLFPTRHAPSVASRVRATLAERGHDEDAIATILDERTAAAVSHERAIPPPAITTEGARTILRRLCDDADVDVDGEYLTPSGAHRGRDTAARTPAGAVSAHGRPNRERSLVAVDVDERLPETLDDDRADDEN